MTRLARTLAAATLLAGAAPTFAQNPLGPARVRAQIAEQKLDSDVTAALAVADRLAQVDPAAAARSLQNAADAARGTREVAPETLAKQLRRLESRSAQLNPAAATPPAPTTPVAATPTPAVAVAAEVKEVNETIRDLRKLYALDRFAEAQSRITALARKYPSNPAVLALEGRGLLAERMAQAADLAREQASRNTLALHDVDRSAMPAKSDMEIAPGSKERWAKRDKMFAVQLDPEAEAILKALEMKVPANYSSGPFREVIQSLSNLIGKKLIVDDRAFSDEGRDASKSIELPTGVSARTALRAVTRAQGMTFIIKESYIQIVTLEEARRSCVKRAYYIGDVLASPTGATLNPLYDAQQSQQMAATIVDTIRRSIDPSVWDGQGGIATVSYHAPSMNIIVSAPAEIQADVSKSMSPRR